MLLLLAVAPRYGWHRDELYFRAAGQHLDWGFVDVPPFTPAVARLADALFGRSLVGLRLFPALATGALVLVAAATARRLGGGARAGGVAAVVTGTTPLFLGTGHLLSTATFDTLAWSVILLLVLRLLGGADRRLWLVVGVAVGVGLLNKHNVGFLLLGLTAGFVATTARRLLVSPWPWLGASIAAVLFLPNVLWHASNDWPVFEMLRSLADESGVEASLLFVPAQLVQTGLAVFVWVPGLVWLLRSEQAAPFRSVGWAYLVIVAVFVASGAKPYYLAGFYPTLVAAGAVAWERRWAPAPWPVVVSAGGLAAALALALPVPPLSWQRAHPIEDLEVEVGAQLGWAEMVDRVAAEIRALPVAERRDVAVFAGNYGEAGAVDLFGPRRGVPRAASPHNNYWLWGPPSDAVVTIAVGASAFERRLFDRCELRHRFGEPQGVASEERGTTLHVCRGQRVPWRDVWDELREYSA